MFQTRHTKDILAEFTRVALSEVCREHWEKEQEKRLRYVPKFLRGHWIFKEKTYDEKGLFAAKDIPKGTYLGTYGSKIIEGKHFQDVDPKDDKYVLRNVDTETKKLIMAMPENNLKYANHSENFNLVVQGKFEFYTARDIKKDEELTWDYGEFFMQKIG